MRAFSEQLITDDYYFVLFKHILFQQISCVHRSKINTHYDKNESLRLFDSSHLLCVLISMAKQGIYFYQFLVIL